MRAGPTINDDDDVDVDDFEIALEVNNAYTRDTCLNVDSAKVITDSFQSLFYKYDTETEFSLCNICPCPGEKEEKGAKSESEQKIATICLLQVIIIIIIMEEQ